MDPCVAKHLCGHRADKVDVYAFKTKIKDQDNTINKHAKNNRAPLMAPQARSGRALVVAVFLETFFEENVGQGPRLWETINTVANLEVNPATGMDLVHEAVLVD